MSSTTKHSKSRRNRIFKLHPTTHAIRHALALGLAMATAQPVFAGTCDVSVPTNAICNGDFTDVSILYAIDDLTLVVGGDLPTTITPLDGMAGIDLYASTGAISLTSFADITAVSTGNFAAGISVRTLDGNASVTNSGDISAATTADVIGPMNVYGIYAASNHGDVTVVNTGNVDISAGGVATSQGYVYGSVNGVALAGISEYGNVSIENGGSLQVTTPGDHQYSSTLFGIVAHSGTGDLTVTNTATGDIDVMHPYGYANGISAYTHEGAVTIGNAGSITVGSAYGAAVAIAAQSKYGDSAVAITNSGSLDVVGYSSTFGVIAKSDMGGTTVDNSGTITAESMHAGVATGINAQGKYGDVQITNTGDIGTSSHDTVYANGGAVGISALTVYDGNINIDNGGHISAYAYAANGINATAKYGDILVSNSAYGEISVDGARSVGVNATAKYDGSAQVDNAGTITASGRYEAVGVHVNTLYGPYGVNPGLAVVNNTGTINATSAFFQATGIIADGYSGTSVTNAGDIAATGYNATGVLANSYFGDTEVINADTGTITATGINLTQGVVVYAGGVGRITNDGTITSTAHRDATGYAGNATAYGSIAAAGISVTLNYGTISAEAIVDTAGDAVAVGSLGYGSAVTIVNEGLMSAEATTGDGVAASFGAYAYAEYAGVYNYSDITATANATTGGSYATGAKAIGVGGSTFYNAAAGTITATSAIGDGNTGAIGVDQQGYYLSELINAGDITASSSVSGFGYASAVGMRSFALGDSLITNSGNISATASVEQALAEAIGIDNFGVYWNGTITNDGTVSATASAVIGYAYATGTRNTDYYGESTVTNNGEITATATTGWGIADAKGIDGFGYAYGASVANTGAITASATADRGYAYAQAVFVYGVDSGASISNDGDIGAFSTAHGDYGRAITIGVQAVSGYFTTTYSSVVNHGDIAAISVADGNLAYASSAGVGVFGKYAAFENTGSVLAEATGSSLAFATGTSTTGWDGVTDYNSGTIASHATAGFYAASRALIDNAYSGGYTATINHGDIIATADVAGDYTTGYGGVAYAFGAAALAKYNADFTNDGTIISSATAPFGFARSVAVSLDSKKGNSTLYNAGLIQATASAYHYDAIAVGVDVEARYVATTVNDGQVSAHADADYSDISATAVGISSSSWGIGGTGVLINHGDVYAGSDALGGKAYSVGVGAMGAAITDLMNDGTVGAASDAEAGLAIARASYAHSTGDKVFQGCAPDYSVCYYTYENGVVTVDNQGELAAQADAASGQAFAYGSVAIGVTTTVTNSGSISALSRADDGMALALGAITMGGEAGLDNSGNIQAVAIANNGDATAMGAVLTGDFAAYANSVWYFYATTYNIDSHAYNSGDIIASADAGTTGIASATGIAAISQHGDVSLTNAGHVVAIAEGADGSIATGVRMDSIGSNTLTNTGSIVASGTNASHIAVWSNDAAVATIDNLGVITGAVRTGAMDDTFTNGVDAEWNVDGTSDFGGGDDIVANSGTVRLFDATITLGDAGAAGNQFANSGLMLVSGDNRIDMGAANAFAFDNTGTINFRDGAPDDILHIGGDLSGSGHLMVDVSGLHGTSDMLYVEGNVVGGSVHTVDVQLLDMPTTASSHITVASVAGNSTAGDFVLGEVRYNPGHFLALAFQPRVVGHIDSANANADVFSLDIDVTGLNDTGSIATAIAPGAQALMASEIGTWRQRAGMLTKATKGGFDAWARVFRNDGTIDPEQTASNFGQGGRFAFDQRNTGVEVGVGYGVGEQFILGALLGKADGNQQLANHGAASNKLDGDTYGVYGTWISPEGFYVDASWRRMRFDARLQSAAGTIRGDGDADAFNIESGYAWTLDSGLTFEPQLQYTHTDVERTDALAGGVAAFRAEGGTASTARAGVMVRKAFTNAGTTWTPYATLNAVHEFDGTNAYSINDAFFGSTSTGGTSALVEGGADVRVDDRISVQGSLLWQDGGALDGVFGGQVSVRFTW